jgi:hypothetical protein
MASKCASLGMRIPPIQTSMKVLDRSQFFKRVSICAIRVPVNKASKAMKALESYVPSGSCGGALRVAIV